MLLPPEVLSTIDQTYPVPLPPWAVRRMVSPGFAPGSRGVMVMPAVTVTATVASLPIESTTFTTSVTRPFRPATYAPVDGSMLPPEALVASDQVNPASVPPEAAKLALPRGGTVTDPGWTVIAGPRSTAAFAELPSESTAWMTSVTRPVRPAW